MPMSPYELLASGASAITASNRAARFALDNPATVPHLVALLACGRPATQARVADAIEKASRENPRLFQPHLSVLLAHALGTSSALTRWHLLVVASRLHLTSRQARSALVVVENCLRAKAPLLQVYGLSPAPALASRHRRFVLVAQAALEAALASSFPSVRARARRIITSRGNAAAGLPNPSLQRTRAGGRRVGLSRTRACGRPETP